jgi:hypothetical protein
MITRSCRPGTWPDVTRPAQRILAQAEDLGALSAQGCRRRPESRTLGECEADRVPQAAP